MIESANGHAHVPEATEERFPIGSTLEKEGADALGVVLGEADIRVHC